LEGIRNSERFELRGDICERGVSRQGVLLWNGESWSRMLANRLNCLPVSCENIRKFVNVVEGKIAAKDIS
jgi:hypothetical protein